MKKMEIYDKIAFYDCVANNDILTSVAQSVKWSNEAHKSGANALYISSKDNTAFKIEYGNVISPIKKELYDSEYVKYTASKAIVSDVNNVANNVANVDSKNTIKEAAKNDIELQNKIKKIVIEIMQESIDLLRQIV